MSASSASSPGASPPGTVFPVSRALLLDAVTPVGLYARLRAAGKTTFLLESVVGGERWARYSILGVGFRARLTGQWRRGGLEIDVTPGPGFCVGSQTGPLIGSKGLEAFLADYRASSHPELPRFWGGLVGVWGHDVIRDFEELRQPARHSGVDLPAMDCVLTDTLVIFDNLSQRVTVVATACPRDDGGEADATRKAEARIAEVIEALTQSRSPEPLELHEDAKFRPEIAEAWRDRPHVERVDDAKEYIVAGDVFQLVLSQRFDQAREELDPFDVYRVLRVTNPAPYMYLLELPSATLAGASPEVLVRVDRDTRRITVRPIAGTRHRGKDSAEDLALEKDLLSDPKERAEHLMLIDLGRNDVGRVATGGSVKMEAEFVIERYSRVMHIVSEVSGELAPGLSAMDALRSAFPAGTLSGAPKVRALELIDQLEPGPRGWYGGAVGYLGYDGGADFAICIRSAVFTESEIRVQAGGGIVFDSDRREEDLECQRKASAVLRAIAMARSARSETPSGGEA